MGSATGRLISSYYGQAVCLICMVLVTWICVTPTNYTKTEKEEEVGVPIADVSGGEKGAVEERDK